MTVIEHERIDAGRDNAPLVFHIYRPANAPRTLCGLLRPPAPRYGLDRPLPPHQCCVMCVEIRGGAW